MQYKSCQNKFNCPDTIGHMGQLFLIGYFLSWLVAKVGWNIHYLWIILFGIIWGLSIEVYECLRWGDKTLAFWPRYKKWMHYRDSEKDILNDTIGVILGVWVYHQFGFSWCLFFIIAFIAALFGRFISWQQFKDKFWDWRFWKYI